MMAVALLGGAAVGLAALGAAESWFHRRRLREIPVRIHVAGTRGKSSVTRLVAAGLREAGVVTAAKTTGTLARMILPDGREVPVFRPAGPNISEQIRVVQAAHSFGAEAIVLECMALQPELHWLSEQRLVRATHGVITNVRADHLDVMGPTEADVARALAGMIPVGGVLITAEQRQLGILERACRDRGSRLVTLQDEDRALVSAQDLARFRYVEHPENVALALRVLRELGVEPSTALPGLLAAQPDPGALTEHVLDFFGRRLVFVNAFAANDPESTEAIWRLAAARHPTERRVLAVFNLRGDRPARTRQLARETRFWHQAHRVILVGSGAYLFAREGMRAGLDPSRIVLADGDRLEDVFESIVEHAGRSALIIGMGNIGGMGLGLVRLFRNRQTLDTDLLAPTPGELTAPPRRPVTATKSPPERGGQAAMAHAKPASGKGS